MPSLFHAAGAERKPGTRVVGLAARAARGYGAAMHLDVTSPLDVAGLRLRSRLWCGSAPWLRPGDDEERLARLRRAGGGLTALVMLRASVRADGRSAPDEPALDGAGGERRLARWIEAVHAGGALALVELTHGGTRAGDLLTTRPWGPAAVRDPVHGRTPAPLPDPDALVADFDAAAARAHAAGADLLGLELAHGALLHSWLSPLGWDRPVDDEVRLALPRRVAQTLAARAPLMATLCAEDLTSDGLSPTQGLAAAGALVDAGAVALVVTAGHRGVRALQRPLQPPGPLRETRHARLAGWVARAVGVPVAVVGGLRSRAVLDALIAAGEVAAVVLERPYACDPDLGLAARDAGWRSRCTSQRDCCPPSSAAVPAPALDCPCAPRHDGRTAAPGRSPTEA